MAVVSVDDLTIAYGNHTVIDHLSFSINEGIFLSWLVKMGSENDSCSLNAWFLKPKSGQ